MGIGEYAQHLIREGHSNIEVAKMVRLRYPNAQTSSRSVASYRCQMRKAGEDVPTFVYRQKL